MRAVQIKDRKRDFFAPVKGAVEMAVIIDIPFNALCCNGFGWAAGLSFAFSHANTVPSIKIT